MLIIPEQSDTLKEVLIKKIKQLPDEIIKELNLIDLVALEGYMKNSTQLGNKYRNLRILSTNRSWLKFKFDTWVINMKSTF
jgi:hypothetical protein